ncbi:MAG TPA: VOC family protein [Micropepsaceae bacterium]|nr:VOC family protein [Micropepsaceae bacterium]
MPKFASRWIPAGVAAAIFATASGYEAAGQDQLGTPGFHHLHLNSVNPDAAIAFYTKEYPSTSKAEWGGFPALRSPNNVLVLFTKVARPPVSDPQITAYWHFGWHVTDVRKNMELYKTRSEVTLAPLYTTDEGGSVLVSSDTWPGTGGVLGLTKAQIADAKAKGVQPAGGAGFAYMRGPDGALIEYQGNMPAERFNHVHMYQEDPFCAQLWYRKHLNAPVPQTAVLRTEADCKVPRGADRSWPALEQQGMFRNPTTGVIFGDVSMNWYMRQTDKPLVGTRGHLMDHVALSVGNLDAWVAKLKNEGVKFLEQPHRLGDTRAVMIEGPSREAIELVEVK